MRSFTTAPIDLLWLMLVPLGICSFFVLRFPGRSGARVAAVVLFNVAWGWAVFYAWMHFALEKPTAEAAFDSVEYLKTELPNSWLWRYLATTQGWIPGSVVFGISWGAAGLWPRRAPA